MVLAFQEDLCPNSVIITLLEARYAHFERFPHLLLSKEVRELRRNIDDSEIIAEKGPESQGPLEGQLSISCGCAG